MLELTPQEKVTFEKAKNLFKLTDEEAYEFIEQGRRIDKGEKLFEPTAEQKANIKKAKNTGTRVYSFSQRQRKENTTKIDIIKGLFDFLGQSEEMINLEITNKERQISFEYLGEKYELTLVQKRKPKK